MRGKIVTLVVAGMVIAAILGGVVGFYSHSMLVDSVNVDGEEQYYRGLYDLCRSAHISADDCLSGVIKARAAKWYEAESVGWKWTPNP